MDMELLNAISTMLDERFEMVLSLFYFLSPSGTSSAHSEKARCLYEDYRNKNQTD